MVEKTVIIAHRRRGSDYWEGYTERSETETHEWVDYFHSVGQIVKVFPSIREFRADCNKMLDKWDKKGSGLKFNLMYEAPSFVTGLLFVSKVNIHF